MSKPKIDYDEREGDPDAVTPEFAEEVLAVFGKHKRVAIVGGPGTGKSSTALLATDRRVFTAREFKPVGLKDAPVAMRVAANGDGTEDNPGEQSFVIEGVWTARALRKGLDVDAVIWLTKPKMQRSPGQVIMAKGIKTVFTEWQRKHAGIPVYKLDGEEAEEAPTTSPRNVSPTVKGRSRSVVDLDV